MTDKTYDLSRRKVLAGLGTIGVAGAGAGLGTSALLSDEEEFEASTITAGTLDMSVSAKIEAANDEYLDAVNDGDLIDYVAEADGEIGAGFDLADFKPGDWVILCIDIGISDNPGCVTVTTDDLVNDDNELTDPEENIAGDTTGGDGEGELGEHLVAEVYEDYTGSGGSTSGDPRDDLDDLDDLDSETPAGTSLNDWHDTYSTGVTIGGSPGIAGNEFSWYMLLELPVDTGNVVQSDSVSWTATFDAVQARNNEDCVVVEES